MTIISKSSRYARVDTYTVTDAQGRTHRVLRTRRVPPTPAVFRHIVTENDRLDLLAFKYYSKSDRFWLICDANNTMRPEELLLPGRRIFIPPDQPG